MNNDEPLGSKNGIMLVAFPDLLVNIKEALVVQRDFIELESDVKIPCISIITKDRLKIYSTFRTTHSRDSAFKMLKGTTCKEVHDESVRLVMDRTLMTTVLRDSFMEARGYATFEDIPSSDFDEILDVCAAFNKRLNDFNNSVYEPKGYRGL